MLKKTFIRLILIVTLVFALFFAFVAHPQAPTTDCAESNNKKDNNYTQGEFIIWETVIRSIPSGTH